MLVTVSTRQVGKVSVVDVSGRVTLGRESNALGEILRSLTSQGHNKILVNLRDVSYLDSSGIGELVSAFTTLTKEGGHLKLLGVSKRLKHLLQMTKNYALFDVHDNEAAAIRSFE